MSQVARVWETPAGVDLGPVDIVPDGGARNFVLQLKAGRFHGFAVRQGSSVFGYVDRCPHAGLPLAQALDAYLTPDGRHITCAWHGALFAPESGQCVAGPCVGQALGAWPLQTRDGRLVTA